MRKILTLITFSLLIPIVLLKNTGAGFPNTIKYKIIQSFFTTKPTGEGTGLSLSLTYGRVVRGHGGIIQIESTDGKRSEFIITLPLT